MPLRLFILRGRLAIALALRYLDDPAPSFPVSRSISPAVPVMAATSGRLNMEVNMHKWIGALAALAVMSAATVAAAGQTCPEGQHYDAEKKMCVPHGK